jgi:hypothetical protein
MSTKCPSAIQSSASISESLVDVTLHVLSFHHKNYDICGTIFKILSTCASGSAFEEKHVTFILTQQVKEFQFMCHSISMFQSRGEMDVIESILIIIKRCVHSDCMTELHKRVKDNIQGLSPLRLSSTVGDLSSSPACSLDAIRSALTHRSDCVDPEACVLSSSCNISANHIALCSSVTNALSAFQETGEEGGGLSPSSEDDHRDREREVEEEVSSSVTGESADEEQEEGEERGKEEEKSDKHPLPLPVRVTGKAAATERAATERAAIAMERVKSPPLTTTPAADAPKRRGSDTLPNEQSFLKRKEGQSLPLSPSLSLTDDCVCEQSIKVK